MNKQRLLTLADHIRHVVPAEQFDMISWAGSQQKPFTNQDLFSCGTAACAVGWATTIPQFKKLGFHLVPDEGPGAFGAIPSFNSLSGYVAVKEFFEIARDEAVFLFASQGYRDSKSREDVANRIERFVTTDGKMMP